MEAPHSQLGNGDDFQSDPQEIKTTLGAAALLILLAASARARIVAPDFFSRTNNLLNLLIARPGHARLFQFFLFLPLKGFFDFIHRGRDLPAAARCRRDRQ